MTNLGRIYLPYPHYTRFNEPIGPATKMEAHRLARGKGGFGLQTQPLRGEVNGISKVFSLVTLDHKSHSHLDALTLRPALHCSHVVRHGVRLHLGGRIIN